MPTATEYSQAIQNLRVTTRDEELQAGEVAVGPLGLPLQYSGNFAVVYQVHCPQTGNDWAVKCFTKDVAGRRKRYRAISEHLQRRRLSFMVDFRYEESAILIGGQWHPLLKMRWVEGAPLNRFVADHLDKPARLQQLLGLWIKLAQRLRRAAVTHADLQHGNVLLVPAPDGEKQRLMLVDYDGLYVPSLADRPSGELGHPAYQHPQRRREGTYSADVDDFSHLAIYCAVRSLMAGGRKLWERFDNGDNLLFREPDFAAPDESELFQRLWRARNKDLRALVGYLILATQRPLDQVPLLDEILSDGQVRLLDSQQEQQLLRLMGDRPAVRGLEKVGQPPPVAEAGSQAAEAGLRVENTTDVLENLVGEWLDDEAPSAQDQPVDALPPLMNLIGIEKAPRTQHRPIDALPMITNSIGNEEAPSLQDQPFAADPMITNSIGMKLALIPAGVFLMGLVDTLGAEFKASNDEQTQHRVRISKPFYLGVHPVTQAQWKSLMGSNPSHFKGPQNPVENVSWNDCQEFIRKLNEQSGEKAGVYRLSTEAEWEYACRAGSTTLFHFGDTVSELDEYAWYAKNSGGSSHPVGEKRPNAWGLYDMHGNLWEWCSDWFSSGDYANLTVYENDPEGPKGGSFRVLRGGCWRLGGASYCRASSRRGYGPSRRDSRLGFRLAMTISSTSR